MNKSTGILAAISAAVVLGAGLIYVSMFGDNPSGHRQFVQTFTGSEKVVFEAGPYAKWAGFNEEYRDVLTIDNTGADGKCEYERGDGFKVQYGDGGMGVICMQAQFPLPTDAPTMLAMHKRFQSEMGVQNKLNSPTLRSLFTNTAKLYTSTEAYSTKSSELQNDIKFQVLNGGYQTTTEEREFETGVDEKGNVVKQRKTFAVIKRKEGNALVFKNPFSEWGMEQSIQIQITGFDFEPKTIDQIALRRDATNRAETAQDNAKAAYWETKQAEADGEKNRVEEEFRQKKMAEVEIQEAEKVKRLALIDASKQKETATLLEQAAVARTKQATQDAIAAKHEAEAIETLAKAQAYKETAMIQAKLPQLQLDNDLKIAAEYASAIQSMNVPAQLTILGGGSSGTQGASEMQSLLQLGVLDKLTEMKAKK